MNNKYANKSQIKKGDIRLNLRENNHIDLKDFDSEHYKKALVRAIAKDPFTRTSTTFCMESNREPIRIFIEKYV